MMSDLAIWNEFVRRPDWFDRAACRTIPTSTFFTNNNDLRPDTADERAAKRVCTDCPVRAECLAFGLEERFGIWGGRTPGERRRIRHIARTTVA